MSTNNQCTEINPMNMSQRRHHVASMSVLHLSYDVAVIQWITSCQKNSYDHTYNNTLARTRNVIDNVRVNNAFSY